MTRTILAAIFICIAVAVVPSSAQRWEMVQLPPPHHNTYWYDIFFLPSNSNLGWACGDKGHVAYTLNAGQTWNGTQVPLRNINQGHLESVHFPTQSVGYTSGPAGVYKTINGGSTWFDVTPNAPIEVWGTYFVSADTGVVLGGGCAGGSSAWRWFFRTTNGGVNWDVFIDSTAANNSGATDAIILHSQGEGWAASSGILWKTLNGGVTWTPFSSTGTRTWHEEITKFNTSFLLPSSGENCSGAGNVGGMRFSISNGFDWREYSVGGAMYGSFLLSEQKGWACGVGRRVYYTNDGGQSWELRNCGVEGDVDDIWFVNETTGWMAGKNALYRLAEAYRGTSRTSLNFGKICYPSTVYDSLWLKLISFSGEGVSFFISGPNASEFSVVSHTSPITLGGCDSVNFLVRCKPATPGQKDALLTILSGNPPNQFDIPLQATASGISLSNFDSLLVIPRAACGASTTAALTVGNTSAENIEVSRLIALPPKKNEIFPKTVFPLNIGPGAAAQIEFSAKPTDTGWVEQKHSILVGSCEKHITVRAYGVSPIISLSGRQVHEVKCAARYDDSVLVSNTGNDTLRISDVLFSSATPNDFIVTGWKDGSLKKQDIPPNQSVWYRYFYLRKNPETESRITFTFYSNDLTTARGNKTAVDISASVRFSGPIIISRASSLDAGKICVGKESVLTFRILNEGTAHAEMNYIDTRNVCARALWREGFPAPQQMPNRDSATVSVIFKPRSVGICRDTLEIRFSPCSDIFKIPLVCEGVETVLAISPAIVQGSVSIGKRVNRTITLHNDGATIARISAITLTPPRADWTLVGFPTLPIVLKPNETITGDIEFNADNVTTFNGTVCAKTDSLCTTEICASIDVQSIETKLDLSADELTFPPQKCNPLPIEQKLTLFNNGSIADTIVSLSIDGDASFALVNPPQQPIPIPPGQSLQLTIGYSPIAEGSHIGELKIVTAKAQETPFAIPLSGSWKTTATTPGIISINVPSLEKCDSIQRYVVVFSNLGSLNDTLTIVRSSPLDWTTIFPKDRIAVPAGETAEFIVEINPAAFPDIAQPYTESFRFKSIVCGLDTIVRLGGSIEKLMAVLEPAVHNIGTVLRADTATKNFTIENIANSLVSVAEIKIEGSGFYCEIPALPVALAPKTSIALPIKFTSDFPGLYEGELFVVAKGVTCFDTLRASISANIEDKQYSATVSMGEYSVPFGRTIRLPLWISGDIADAGVDHIDAEIRFDGFLFAPSKIFRFGASDDTLTSLQHKIEFHSVNLMLSGETFRDMRQKSDTLVWIEGFTFHSVPNVTPLTIEKFDVASRRATDIQKRHGSLEVTPYCMKLGSIGVRPVAAMSLLSEHPIRESMTLELLSTGEQYAQVQLMDAMGNIVFRHSGIPVTTVPQTITFNVGNLLSGVYELNLYSLGQSQRQTVVIVR